MGFLDLIAVLVVLPMCGAGFLALTSFLAARHPPHEGWIALGQTVTMLIFFLLCMTIFVGSRWLANSIRFNNRDAEDIDRLEPPKGLTQTVVVPVLVVTIIHSTCATIAGLGMKIYLGQSSIQWIAVWLLVTGVLGAALRRLL